MTLNGGGGITLNLSSMCGRVLRIFMHKDAKIILAKKVILLLFSKALVAVGVYK